MMSISDKVKEITVPWQWSVTGNALRGRSVESIRTVLAKGGWDGLEGHNHIFADEPRKPEALKAFFAEGGVGVTTYHLPYGFEDDLADFDEGGRKAAVDRVLEAMECAVALGAKAGVMHPTVSRTGVETVGFDTFLTALDRSLAVLLPRAEALGFMLAVENMCPRPPGTRFGSRPEHFERFAAAFGHPNLGFCYDTGHALMAMHGHALEILDAMGDRLAAVHLADNAGDRDSHLAPGRGFVDWTGVFRRMRGAGFRGVACVETPPFAYGPDYSLEAWRLHSANVRQLAAAALA